MGGDRGVANATPTPLRKGNSKSPHNNANAALGDFAMPWEERRAIIEAQQNANRLERERAEFDWYGGRLWPILKAKRLESVEHFVRQVLQAEEKEDYLVSLLVEFRLRDKDFDAEAMVKNGNLPPKTIAQLSESLNVTHAEKQRRSFTESKKFVEKWKLFFEFVGRLGTIQLLDRLFSWFVTLCKVKQISVRQASTVAALSILHGVSLRLYFVEEEIEQAAESDRDINHIIRSEVDPAVQFRKKMVSLLYNTEKFSEGQIRDECPMIRLECVRFMQQSASLPCTPFGPNLWLPNALNAITHIIHGDPAVSLRRQAVQVVHEIIAERDFTTLPLEQLPDFDALFDTLLRHAYDNDYHVQIQCIEVLGEFAKNKRVDLTSYKMQGKKQEWNNTMKKLFFHSDADISTSAMRFFDCAVFPKSLEATNAQEFHDTVIGFLCDSAPDQPYLATRLVDRTRYHEMWDWSILVKLLENPNESGLPTNQKRRRQMAILALMDAIVRDHSDLYEVVPALQDVYRILNDFNSGGAETFYLDEDKGEFMLYSMAECALGRAFSGTTPPSDIAGVLKSWRGIVRTCLTTFRNKHSIVVASKMLDIVPKNHWKIAAEDIMATLIEELRRIKESGKPSSLQNACKFSLSALARFHFVPSKVLVQFDKLERVRFDADKSLPNWYALQFYAFASLQRPERAHGVQWMMVETLASEGSDHHAKAVAFQGLLALTDLLQKNTKIQSKPKSVTEAVLGHAMGYFGGMAMGLPTEPDQQTLTDHVVPAGHELGSLCDLFAHHPTRLSGSNWMRLFVIHASHVLNSLEHVISRRLASIVLAIASNSPQLCYLADELVRRLRRFHPKAFCTIVLDALRWENTRLKISVEENPELQQDSAGRVADSMSQIAKRVASRFISFDAQYSAALSKAIVEALAFPSEENPRNLDWILATKAIINRMPKNAEFDDFISSVLKYKHIQDRQDLCAFFKVFRRSELNKRTREDADGNARANTPNSQLSRSEESHFNSCFVTPVRSARKRLRTNSRAGAATGTVRLPKLEHSVHITGQAESSAGSTEHYYAHQAMVADMEMPASPISIEGSTDDEGSDYRGSRNMTSACSSAPMLGAASRSMAQNLTPTQTSSCDTRPQLSQGMQNKRFVSTQGPGETQTQNSVASDAVGMAKKPRRKPPVPLFEPNASQSSLASRTTLVGQNRPMASISPTVAQTQRNTQDTELDDDDAMTSQSARGRSGATTHVNLRTGNQGKRGYARSITETQNSMSSKPTLVGQNRPISSISPTVAQTQGSTQHDTSYDDDGAASQSASDQGSVNGGSGNAKESRGRKQRTGKPVKPSSQVETQNSSSSGPTLVGQNRPMSSISPTVALTQSTVCDATPAVASNAQKVDGAQGTATGSTRKAGRPAKAKTKCQPATQVSTATASEVRPRRMSDSNDSAVKKTQASSGSVGTAVAKKRGRGKREISAAVPASLFGDDGLAPSLQQLIFEESDDDANSGAENGGGKRSEDGGESAQSVSPGMPAKRSKVERVKQSNTQGTQPQSRTKRGKNTNEALRGRKAKEVKESNTQMSSEYTVHKASGQSAVTFGSPGTQAPSTFSFGARGHRLRSVSKSMGSRASENSPNRDALTPNGDWE